VTPNLVINEASFVVRVSSSSSSSSGGGGGALDYERLRMVNLTLVAEEVAEDRRRTSIPLTIHIREVKLQIRLQTQKKNFLFFAVIPEDTF
jgi:hypothetical protein